MRKYMLYMYMCYLYASCSDMKMVVVEFSGLSSGAWVFHSVHLCSNWFFLFYLIQWLHFDFSYFSSSYALADQQLLLYISIPTESCPLDHGQILSCSKKSTNEIYSNMIYSLDIHYAYFYALKPFQNDLVLINFL